ESLTPSDAVERLAETPAGSPSTDRSTATENPVERVTDTPMVAVWPSAKDSAVDDALTAMDFVVVVGVVVVGVEGAGVVASPPHAASTASRVAVNRRQELTDIS